MCRNGVGAKSVASVQREMRQVERNLLLRYYGNKFHYFDETEIRKRISVKIHPSYFGKGVFAEKDFAAGEVVYTELPLASHGINPPTKYLSCPAPEESDQRLYCSHCLKSVLTFDKGYNWSEGIKNDLVCTVICLLIDMLGLILFTRFKYSVPDDLS